MTELSSSRDSDTSSSEGQLVESNHKCRMLMFAGLLSFGCIDPAAPGHLVPPTVDEDPSLPRADFEGSAFHLQTFGDPTNPTVIFLHGGPGLDHRGLLRLRERVDGQRLEDEYFLVFWDQRGTGLSRRHERSEIDVDAYARDLEHVIDEFDHGRKVALVGHSWGGMYGSQYIGTHPDRVAGALFIEPGPLTQALYDSLPGELDITSEALNDYLLSERLVSPDDHVRADYQAAVGQMSQETAVFWRLGAVALTAMQQHFLEQWPDFTAGLDRFAGPVLLIAGDVSEFGAAFQKRQRVLFNDAELQVLIGADHDAPWMNSAAVVELGLPFLRSLSFE